MARRRHELSDQEWALLEPMLPHLQTPGRHYRDHPTVLNGMLFRLTTGILPPRFDALQYRRRNVVERCAGWLKQSCAVATRFKKLPSTTLEALSWR